MNSKNLVLVLILLAPFISFSQLYKSESSYIKFFSEAPLENIEAENKKATGVLKLDNNQMAIVIPIKAFEFEKALMQEHFNETYMESDVYKNATFKGFIDQKINWKKDGEYDASATGTMHIHGVDQKVTIKGKLTIKDGKIKLESKFNISIADYKIKIPSAVVTNIAEVVEVTMNMMLGPKQ
ncbi:MAG: polyisoprenoid-binding protein [Crocinitomicaceae bacterium]|nr:polyisoprenoid-binding protein [Crocinitomicaceae bacterium]|tara:strand:- start:1187 stop:1732 length:546 start_codon:yes stop_codon:yes gene_type:complete